MNPDTEAEVLTLPFELIRVAKGHPMTVKDSEGRRLTLRLYTPEEFRRTQHELVDDPDMEISMLQARQLTQPLPDSKASDEYANRLRRRIVQAQAELDAYLAS